MDKSDVIAVASAVIKKVTKSKDVKISPKQKRKKHKKNGKKKKKYKKQETRLFL